jgi:shikimate dehydrogenase
MGMGLTVSAGELDRLRLPGPVVLFLGVSTAASAVHRYFPQWAGRFPEPLRLIGIDLPVAASEREYEDLLDWMARHRQVRGMVITSHKIGVFRAGSARFAAADRLAGTLGETSAVRRAPSGDLLAYATDPLSARAAAAELNLGTSGGQTVCFGAGGAALALVAALTLPGTELTLGTRPAPDARGRALGADDASGPLSTGDIQVTDVQSGRLANLMHVAARLGVASRVIPHLQQDASGNTRLLAGLLDAHLVVNATGLGKDSPGSPLTDEAVFPRHCIAWDMNYRGPLTFLRQARAQQHARGLQIADGWRFFLHGWANALARILDVPPGDPALAGTMDTQRTSSRWGPITQDE